MIEDIYRVDITYYMGQGCVEGNEIVGKTFIPENVVFSLQTSIACNNYYMDDISCIKQDEIGDWSSTWQMCEVCGNNIIEGDEECDDGNVIDADGCSSECFNECGCIISLSSSSCKRRCLASVVLSWKSVDVNMTTNSGTKQKLIQIQ